MNEKYNAPVTIQIYLGSGKVGERLRENLKKMASKKGSLSELVVSLLKKAEPNLTKGLDVK